MFATVVKRLKPLVLQPRFRVTLVWDWYLRYGYHLLLFLFSTWPLDSVGHIPEQPSVGDAFVLLRRDSILGPYRHLDQDTAFGGKTNVGKYRGNLADEHGLMKGHGFDARQSGHLLACRFIVAVVVVVDMPCSGNHSGLFHELKDSSSVDVSRDIGIVRKEETSNNWNRTRG